jgi:tetraacyldisaccharide 4'-kinase
MTQISKINRWLLPLSWIYGAGVQLRNGLYNMGRLKSHTFPIPIICVGNLVAGGTGKTPMIEYLARILEGDFKVAIVSRGYRRKSTGLKEVTLGDNADRIGDEPAQLLRKFGDKIQIVVDGNRVRAINHLVNQPYSQRPDVILMDDGFQHRSVLPSLSILLSSYNRLMTDDALLPAGRLRESARGRYRADIVVVTKCPPLLKPIDCTFTERRLDLYPHQMLLFSEVIYDDPVPIFGQDIQPTKIDTNAVVVAVSGISHPEEFFDYLRRGFSRVTTLPYSDHHRYSIRNVTTWENILTDYMIRGAEVVFLCTDKDAVKIYELESYMSEELRKRFLRLPIQMRFKSHGEERMREAVLEHIVHFAQKQL